VLTEEALLLVVILGACVLLVLGTLELVSPTRSRHPRRPRAAPRRHPSRARASGVPSSARPAPPPALARCEALLADMRYAEVVAEASAALAPAEPGAPALAGEEEAALWSMVGRARQAVTDDEGARAAFESAIAVAPSSARAEPEQQLGALVLGVARALLDRAVDEPAGEPEERVTEIRDAIAWLDRGLTLREEDGALVDLHTAARAALWPAYEDAVRGLVQRHEYHRARRLLGQALAERETPPSRQQALRDLLSGTFSSEIGQLSAQAFRSLRESRETEALAALRRAEELIGAMPEDALPTPRREEVDRRLLWGYTRLGRRRVERGQFEAALEPLLRALRLDANGGDTGEARVVLVRGLEGLVDTRAPAIRALADGGDRAATVAQCERLWALLTSARDAGLTHDDLAGVLAKARRLFEALG
jgi:tetratricopeptide (TPR) repeat protein